MRYTIATFALAATAAAVPQYGYQAEESSSAPAHVASSSMPVYAASSSVPAYIASSSAVASSSAPAYAASTPVYSASSVAYPVASSSVKYEEYPVTSTKVVQETTFVCPEPTVITYESHVYSMTKPGTLSVPAYTTTVVVSTKTPEVEKPTSKAVETPVHSASVPVAPYPTAPYPVVPSGTGVVPSVPAGTGSPTKTGGYTKPSSPSEFTGAASALNVGGFVAGVGAFAAFFL